MAIKAGQILHVANNFVVDRIQTAGGQLNIPQEKVFELGNFESVGIVRDVPDLSFSLDCLDVDTEVEALLCGSLDPFADIAGTEYDLGLNKPIDIVSPWKTSTGVFNAVHGVAIPYLYLESASYKYGLSENAGETFSLKGDSLFYIPGTPWQDMILGSDLTIGVHTYDHGPALLYTEGGVALYALCVTVNGMRKMVGIDYTATATAVTFLGTGGAIIPTGTDRISIVYGGATGAYPQAGQSPAGAGTTNLVHQGTAVKPSAIRGKDIQVWFTPQGGPRLRWTDVQSASVDWKVTLEEDREFGNSRAVGRDATDVPMVSGTIEVKPRSIAAFFGRLAEITGVPTTDIVGPDSSVKGELEVVLHNPNTGGGGSSGMAVGAILKRHYIDAARFTVPGYEGRVQQKLSTTLNWESDTGAHKIFKGDDPVSAGAGSDTTGTMVDR